MVQLTKNEKYDVDIRTVDPDTLVDIGDVVIDTSLPPEKKMEQFLEQVKNPLCYKKDGIIIKNVYKSVGVKLEDCFREIVMTMQN
jgi:hypothetical protein